MSYTNDREVVSQAEQSDSVKGFFGEYRFLSNFWYVAVQWEGVTYPTTEHAYQAAKTLVPEERAMFVRCQTPADAKRLGRKVTLRFDWEQIKIDVMRDLLVQKFSYPFFADKLLAITGYIEETNTWGDIFWGVCNGKGRNELGKLLMNIRDNIRMQRILM